MSELSETSQAQWRTPVTTDIWESEEEGLYVWGQHVWGQLGGTLTQNKRKRTLGKAPWHGICLKYTDWPEILSQYSNNNKDDDDNLSEMFQKLSKGSFKTIKHNR